MDSSVGGNVTKSLEEIDIDYLNVAIDLAKLSEDPSVQNGAIIINANEVGLPNLVGLGWNHIPMGKGGPERWERPAKYMWVEHAERAAIYNAARAGSPSLVGATMYCPWASCADCGRAIVESGIARLVRLPMGLAEGWNESLSIADQIMAECGVEIVTIEMDQVKIPEGLRLGQFRDNPKSKLLL